MIIWGKCGPGRGHSPCKDPGEGPDLVCWRNSEEARVCLEQSERGGEQGGQRNRRLLSTKKGSAEVGDNKYTVVHFFLLRVFL